MLWILEDLDDDGGRPVFDRPPCADGGLRTSHYAACAADGMTEEEIDMDWEIVEKDLRAMNDEGFEVIE